MEEDDNIGLKLSSSDAGDVSILRSMRQEAFDAQPPCWISCIRTLRLAGLTWSSVANLPVAF